MKYGLKMAKLDLGMTPYENIFLNNYLAIADGNSVKLYLYAYKKAYERVEINESFEEIGSHLGMSGDEVADAFGFWQEQGVVDIDVDGEDFRCNFKSLRDLFLGFDPLKDSDSDEEIKKDETQARLLSNDEDTSLSNTQMYEQIEKVLGTSLLPGEIEKIHKLKEEFKQDRDLIVEGFSYCSTSQGKKNVNYVCTVLRNWAIDGIRTMEDLAKNKIKKEEASNKKRTPSRKKKLVKSDKKTSDEIQEALNRKLLEDFKKAQGD